MTNSEKKKKSGMPTFLILLMFIAATGFWYVAIYSDGSQFMMIDMMETHASGYEFVGDTQTNATKIELTVDADVADITLKNFGGFSGNIIQLDWDYSCYSETDTPFTIDVDYYSANDTLYYSVSIVQIADRIMSLDIFDVIIFVSGNATQLDISLQTGVGRVDVDLIEATIGDLFLETTTGSIDVSIVDSTLSTYTTITSTTGSINVDFTNLEFSASAAVSIDATTGSIDLEWNQFVAFTSDIVLDLDVTTGSIEFYISSPLILTSYDVYFSTSLGEIVFGGDTDEFVELGENHYQSTDYETSLADVLTITADTSLGSIDAAIYVD
jgi:hypothetical protein